MTYIPDHKKMVDRITKNRLKTLSEIADTWDPSKDLLAYQKSILFDVDNNMAARRIGKQRHTQCAMVSRAIKMLEGK